MRFVIIAGMSGAGKSTTIKMLEDIGFFCVSNLPIELLPHFGQIASDGSQEVNEVAVSIHISQESQIDILQKQLYVLGELGIAYEILYLEADKDTLIKRYKETRRTHPLAKEDRIEIGISKERKLLAFIRKKADYIIDTTSLLTRELKQELDKIFIQKNTYNNFIITVLSFGFKNGIPIDADLVFDVRFLPNPYYDLTLRPLTGNDLPIQEYVMNSEASHQFLDKLEDMIAFLIPHYLDEGKYRLVIAIGCTGGKHRSVTIANELYDRLKKYPYSIRKEHRDIKKDAFIKAHSEEEVKELELKSE